MEEAPASESKLSRNAPSLADRYLDLLAETLLDQVYPGSLAYDGSVSSPASQNDGSVWPARAYTMIGRLRLRNVRDCVETALRDGVVGDVVEAGVWRGGACIFMRGLLEARGDTARRVFVADSFAGLPPPDPIAYPVDAGDGHHTVAFLAVGLGEVRANFARCGLLDDRVVFVEGFFSESLPGPIERIAVLRMDGDMYSSTMQTLESLYDRVSDGGFVIVDDYALRGCRAAVDDFRATRGIDTPLSVVDWTGVWWRK
jgi:O-methyltransferase